MKARQDSPFTKFLNIIPMSKSLVLLVALLSLNSCVTVGWKQAELLESNDFVSIYLEEYRGEEREPVDQGLQHPIIDLDVHQLAALFASVSYRESRLLLDDHQGSLIHERIVWDLAEALAKHLPNLTSAQRLRFLVHRMERVAIFTGVYLTSGVLFSEEEGKVDLAIDMIEERFLPDDVDPKSMRFYRKPTRMFNSGYSLQLPKGFTLTTNSESNRTHPLWFKAPISEINNLVEIAKEAKSKSNTPKTVITQPKTNEEPKVTIKKTSAPNESSSTPKSLIVYQGCDIYQVGSQYYGLPPGSGTLDLDKIKNRSYKLIFQGNNVKEVTSSIDQAVEAGLLKR